MSDCAACPAWAHLEQMGIDVRRVDRVVALAGNPNTGKSTVFNALTGLRQHTGNWPGKTVTRAEGGYEFAGVRYKLVDLPGTYSLLSASQDEEIARDFLLFGQPDCTIVVVDATCLERNLNLVLQVLEVTERVVVGVNLMDEAKRKGIAVDTRTLARDLGVPAVAMAARSGEGLRELIATVADVIEGKIRTAPRRSGRDAAAASTTAQAVQRALDELVPMVQTIAPDLPNARWVALRLLDGDMRVREALLSGELAQIAARQRTAPARASAKMALEGAQ